MSLFKNAFKITSWEREGKKRKEEGRREGKEVSSKTNDDSVMSQDYR